MHILVISLIGMMLCFGFLDTSDAALAKTNKVIRIDNFDAASTDNLLGGTTQGDEENIEGCIPLFTQDSSSAFGLSGHSLQLDFDVTFPGTFSFYTTHLGPPGIDRVRSQTIDLSSYAYFSFWYRTELPRINFSVEAHRDSDGDGNFLLGKDSSSKVVVAKYTKDHTPGQWHKVTIPFANFKEMRTWEQMYEMVFVFENVLQSGKGTVYIDELLFGMNYPTTPEDEANPFPGNMTVNLFMMNGNKVGSRFVLGKYNTFEVLLKNVHPLLERLAIEVSTYGSQDWKTACAFYEHDTGMYHGEWSLDLSQKTYYFLRIVAYDVFGKETILSGPFGGTFIPEGTTP